MLVAAMRSARRTRHRRHESTQPVTVTMEPPRLLDGRLKLRHLVLVDALVDRGSVVRAAAQLHVTQPVATRALRELEDVLGVELFERGPRGLTPTVFGLAFVHHARAVLAELHAAAQHVADLAGAERGTVTVGTYLAGSSLLLPRAIVNLKAQRPQLTVVVREATPDVLLVDLLSGRCDFILGRLTPLTEEARVRQEPLHEEPVRLVTRSGHPALRLADVQLKDLLAYPWILPASETVLRRELAEVFLRAELPWPENRIECTSILTLRELLVATDAIAVLPMLIARADDRLALLSTKVEPLRRQVGVTFVGDRRLSPSAEALLEVLREAAAELTRASKA